MKMKAVCFSFFLIFPIFLWAGPSKILPEPKIYKTQSGHFHFPDQIKIIVHPAYFSGQSLAVSRIQEIILKRTGFFSEVIVKEQTECSSCIILTGIQDPILQNQNQKELFDNPESYQIRVEPSRIILASVSQQGLFYAGQTLAQLIESNNKSLKIPCQEIQDWPSFKIRGISDDISRGQVSKMDHFKKVIRFLSEFKMNSYFIYLEDLFVLKSYPSIGKRRGALSRQEFRELQDYAKQYFVEIIPIFQTLGHYENLLCQEEFYSIAEYPGATSLNPTGEESRIFLERVLGEILPVFDSKYFHMGADESWDIGFGKSREKVKLFGLSEVLSSHYLFVIDLLKRFNKTPILYSDMILKNLPILKKLPKDAIIMDWQYLPEGNYPSLKEFQKTGFEFWVSPAIWNWRKVFPRFHHAEKNISSLNKSGFLSGAKGSIVSSWGDDGGETFRDLNYYGYALGAAFSWSPLQQKLQDVLPLFLEYFFGVRDTRLEEIFNTFADISFFSDYHNLWRHPFLPFKKVNEDQSENGYFQKASMIRKKAWDILSKISQVKNQVKKNQDILAYLDFGARSMLWFADKIQFSIEIKKISQLTSLNESQIRRGLEICDKMMDTLKGLRNEYRELWLNVNREDNLELILKRYEMQLSYWQEKKDELISRQLKNDYEIASRWIYHDPNADKGWSAVKSSFVIFQKSFNYQESFQKSYLQVIGQGYGVVRLNGYRLGGFSAQRTLSLTVEFQRVQYWEVSKYLRQGSNTIEIEFYPSPISRFSGINVYFEALGSQKSFFIFSDSSWASARMAKSFFEEQFDYFIPQWLSQKVHPLKWSAVKGKKAPYLVSRPYFQIERKSWIEN